MSRTSVNVICHKDNLQCPQLVELDKVLKPEWKDKPDSEGWWIMRLQLGRTYYSLHKVDQGFIANCEAHKEIRWTKALVPEGG